MVLSLVVFGISVVVLPILFVKIIYPELIRKKPSYAFIASAFFVLIGFLTAFFIFSSALSMAMVSFASLFLLPFVLKLLENQEESVAEKALGPQSIGEMMKKHEKLMIFYIFLFFGMALEYTLLFGLLPPSLGNVAFDQQLQSIGTNINEATPIGQFTAPFGEIIVNNLQIAFIAFFLSVFFGAGSILVLNFNASVIGVMYGASIRTLLYGGTAFAANIVAFLPHTILEILGYLLAAVGGGILVKGINRSNLIDASIFFTIGILLLFVAAFVEVTVPFL